MYKSDYMRSPACDDFQTRFNEIVISEAERIKPILSEQFLREYIFGVGDTNEIFNIYCSAFNIEPSLETRMVILKPSGANDFEDYFFIKNIAGQYIGKENLLLSTIVNDFIIVVTTILDRTKITGLLDKIRNEVKNCYDYSIMAIYSRTSYISDAPSSYERLKICMGYSFYSDSDRTLYENDITINDGKRDLQPEYGAIEHSVRSGDGNKVRMLLSGFFKSLEKSMPTPAIAKTYCMELYVCIIRCCEVDRIDRYMNGITYIQDAKSIGEIKNFILEKGLEISENNAPETSRIYSSLIRDTINIIDENIENENLSLRWLASTVLYTNVDYLGKLFKKETGKNFSHYVMEKRMEMAKELIINGKKDRIYEVAEKVGYGSNSQYFSQVFKKYTGVSPLEYREFSRLEKEKKANKNNP